MSDRLTPKSIAQIHEIAKAVGNKTNQTDPQRYRRIKKKQTNKIWRLTRRCNQRNFENPDGYEGGRGPHRGGGEEKGWGKKYSSRGKGDEGQVFVKMSKMRGQMKIGINGGGDVWDYVVII